MSHMTALRWLLLAVGLSTVLHCGRATEVSSSPSVASERPTRETLEESRARRAKAKTATPGAPSCHPSYTGACLPVRGPDLDCKDIGVRNFAVVGPDVYRLDRDRDGWACER